MSCILTSEVRRSCAALHLACTAMAHVQLTHTDVALAVTLLLPQQQPLSSTYPGTTFQKIAPVTGIEAGVRSLSGNHWNIWHCPESDSGKQIYN